MKPHASAGRSAQTGDRSGLKLSSNPALARTRTVAPTVGAVDGRIQTVHRVARSDTNMGGGGEGAAVQLCRRGVLMSVAAGVGSTVVPGRALASSQGSEAPKACRPSGMTTGQTTMGSEAPKACRPSGTTTGQTTMGSEAPKVIMSFPKVHPGMRINDPASELQCEIFVDFTCPYSRKMFGALRSLMPEYPQICFVFHNVIQPWHHQSLWLHETTFAVKMLKPEKLFDFWVALYEVAPNYYDGEIYDLTRAQFYDKMADLAASVCTEDGKAGDVAQFKAQVLSWLIPPLQPGGSFPEAARALGATPEDDENGIFLLTRQIVKFQRKRGVHVTPTVIFNGIEQPQISSAWGEAEWKIFLDAVLAM